MLDTAKSTEAREEQRLVVHYDTRLPELTRWQRLQIPVIAWAGYWLVRLLGPTLRFEVLGWQHAERSHAGSQRIIWPFWHRSIFPILWWARHRGIVVMNTTHFDGQWTRRVIERLGYGTAQGSSTRGGLRGLAVMAERLQQGPDVGLTLAGPRGPPHRPQPRPGPAYRLPDSGLSRRARAGAYLQKYLGPLSDPLSVLPRGNYLQPADLRAERRGPRNARAQASGDAGGARARPEHR